VLAGELQEIERQARQHRAGVKEAYSRSLLAAESGVSEKTLSSWLDGERIPQDSGNLMRVVEVLANWAGQGKPAEQDWKKLQAAARKRAVTPKAKRASRVTIASLATAAAAAVITGIFTPVGQSLSGLFGSAAASPSQSASSQQGQATEDLQVSAS
jgi:hypothetical protein